MTAAGVAFDSLRHRGGVNAVAYRPRQILEVTQADRFEITAPVDGAVVARRIRPPDGPAGSGHRP